MTDVYNGKTVLIAGGTRGIGLSSALEFAKQGADVWLTHCWGSVAEADIFATFSAQGIKSKPRIIKADVTQPEETEKLLTLMKGETAKIEAFVCCAGMLKRTESLKDYSKSAFLKTMDYMAWPIVDYTLKIEKIFGTYPRYIVGMTTYSTIAFNNHYDLGAAAKAAIEVLMRYMAVRLAPHDCRFNILRPPMVDTQALTVFGEENLQKMKILMPSGMQMSADEVGKAVYGLCSGYFDTMSGQILNLDKGATFVDNCLGLIEREDFAQVLAKLAALPS